MATDFVVLYLLTFWLVYGFLYALLAALTEAFYK